MRYLARSFMLCSAALLAGCAHYRFGNPVPRESRAVSVAVFENASSQPEAEALLTQAVCREFVREGSMRLTAPERAAIQVSGKVTEYSQKPVRYAPADADTPVEFRIHMSAVVTATEKASGKILFGPATLAADTTCLTRGDLPTAKRDALHRAAHELGRQIVQSVIDIW